MQDRNPKPSRLALIVPDWPAPARVRALSTTRRGGVSRAPFDTLNLAQHVGDTPEAVAENRARLLTAGKLPETPRWIEQVHGNVVAEAARITPGITVQADASYTREPGVVCAVLTADCLPVLLCDRAGTAVAVAHAGWRGVAGGIIEATVKALDMAPDALLAWLGPAIGPHAFEVGPEVREALLAGDPDCADAFRPSPGGRWHADLHHLARRRLNRRGITQVYGGGHCTFEEAERFFSYRRDGVTGRMATLIWIEGLDLSPSLP